MSTATVSQPQPWQRWIPTPPVLAAWGILLATFVWSYWSELFHLVHVWATTPDMGHGFAVPIFAAYLLWHRQEMVNPWPNRGTLWCIPFFLAFALFRWMVLFLRYDRDVDSLFPFFIGMTLAIGGWKALRWAWPSILMLVFMVPLPDRFSKALASVLQHGATVMSVYVLQTIGIPAIVRGAGSNEIELSSPPPLEVAQACSGLRMMTVFFAMCIGACFILREPLWKKIVLIVSAAPIAIVSNVARITLTGVLQEWVNVGAAHYFHENLGVLMVIPAFLLIWGELVLVSALIIEPHSEGPLVFADGAGMPRRRSAPAMESMARPGAGGTGPLPRGPRQPPPI